jgi:hypothetical protein
MPLQVAKQDISKPTQRMLTLHTVAIRWPIEFFQQKNRSRKRYLSYPESNIGLLPVPKKYRFQWTYQLFFASQPKRMYVTSQVVHVTEDQGHSFEIISPDLSRNDPKLQEKQADQ